MLIVVLFVQLLFTFSPPFNEDKDVMLDDVNFEYCAENDIPPGSDQLSCDFENDTCSWYHDYTASLLWKKTKTVSKDLTGNGEYGNSDPSDSNIKLFYLLVQSTLLRRHKPTQWPHTFPLVYIKVIPQDSRLCNSVLRSILGLILSGLSSFQFQKGFSTPLLLGSCLGFSLILYGLTLIM